MPESSPVFDLELVAALDCLGDSAMHMLPVFRMHDFKPALKMTSELSGLKAVQALDQRRLLHLFGRNILVLVVHVGGSLSDGQLLVRHAETR